MGGRGGGGGAAGRQRHPKIHPLLPISYLLLQITMRSPSQLTTEELIAAKKNTLRLLQSFSDELDTTSSPSRFDRVAVLYKRSMTMLETIGRELNRRAETARGTPR